MSRLAKQAIMIPPATEVTVASGSMQVKGKKGSLAKPVHPQISVVVSDGGVQVSSKGDTPEVRALLGTHASHMRNMIEGVNNGFSKRLLIEGVGYKWEVTGKNLTMALGFSHPVVMPIPEGLTVAIEKGALTVSGIDKEAVGQFAANVRKQKKPEPYKGKGIRYDGEVIRRKAGKKTA